jgi:hypothetical protein
MKFMHTQRCYNPRRIGLYVPAKYFAGDPTGTGRMPWMLL